MNGRIAIDNITPSLGEGHFPSKGVVGECVPITATIWREGHDAVGGTVLMQVPKKILAIVTKPQNHDHHPV